MYITMIVFKQAQKRDFMFLLTFWLSVKVKS